MVYSQGEAADVTMDLSRSGDHPGLSGWALNAVTSVPIRERWRWFDRDRRDPGSRAPLPWRQGPEVRNAGLWHKLERARKRLLSSQPAEASRPADTWTLAKGDHVWPSTLQNYRRVSVHGEA